MGFDISYVLVSLLTVLATKCPALKRMVKGETFSEC